MACLFAIDISLGSESLLHGLYIFPLAALVIHGTQRLQVLAGFMLAVAFQVIAFALFDPSLSLKIANSVVAILSSALIVYLAAILRANYLETLDLSLRDSLTGLLNRRAFESTLEIEIARQKRYGGVFSIALIDLDRFKELNDSRGHAAGDSALKLVTKVLREEVRESDSIGRLGGDEFVVLMPNTHAADGVSRSMGLSEKIAREMLANGFPCTASIGHVAFERAPATHFDALARADQAMYEAKGRRHRATPGS